MKMTSIKKVEAQEILDSRGNPTVRAWVTLRDGSIGEASVPSGASTGVHEAHELRDGGRRYGGKGVTKAIKHVEKNIARAVKGLDATKQRVVDETMIELDGTEHKTKLGANAILAVSLATARAAAISKKKPLYKYLRQTFSLTEKSWILPHPTMNIINGGRHADNGLSVQEFMIVPNHKYMTNRVQMGSEIFHTLGKLLSSKGYNIGVGDEGGYAPELRTNEHALKFIVQAIQKSGYTPGTDVFLAMDVAASEFYRNGRYYFTGKKQASTPDRLIRDLSSWARKYPIVSIEDPLAEDDWENWALMTKKLGKRIDIVGDDLFVTNTARIQEGIDKKVGNAVLIKLNQIGTLSETIDAIYLAKKHGYKVSVSHRSGETADTFIADLAVAVNAEYIKTGSLSRSERIEKYNRLMQIESEVKKK